MRSISADELAHLPSSRRDDAGRLYRWEGKLLRGVRKPQSGFYRDLARSELLAGLVADGLVVSTEATDYKISGYDLVLRHGEVPFVSYCFEWPPSMQRSAALLLLEIQRRLLGHGLTLKDAHPWNVLFQGSHPIFVDVTSIVPIPWLLSSKLHHPADEFARFVLHPVEIAEVGFGEIARSLLRARRGVRTDEFHQLTHVCSHREVFLHHMRSSSRTIRQRIPEALKSHIAGFLSSKAGPSFEPVTASWLDPELVEQLSERLSELGLRARPSIWTGYHYEAEPEKRAAMDLKIQAVMAVLERIKPLTVLDVGCNEGKVALSAASKFTDVVGIDSDEPALSRLYGSAKKADVSVLPLLLDVLNPTPESWHGTKWPSARERLQVEMVLALALVHHLVYYQGATFEEMADAFAQHQPRYLLIEFVGPGDRYVRPFGPPNFEKYDFDTFQAAFLRHFSHSEIIFRQGERQLILFSR